MRVLSLILAVSSSLSGLALSAGPAAADHPVFPAIIQLPDGFHPEGIASGRGTTVYVAQIDNGSIYQADARTGAGLVLVPPQPGRAAVGLKFDDRTNFLFVAGGPTGHAYVYDADTGTSLADYTLSAGSSFINDVILTRQAAYFTDSFQSVLYVLPLGRRGQLPAQGEVKILPLSGDFEAVPGAFNTNGIEATRDGKRLIIVNGSTGKLFLVDPRTGVANEIDLGGGSVVNGDGLVLRGRTLFVVENFSNQVAVVSLSHHLGRGTVVETITNPAFDIPATATLVGNALYVTNARFTTPVTPTTPYSVVRVPLGY